ncbi:MAG: division/cell wall cluster transcriptional repressor MraZ [Deltaproteobacteria bacterium]|nr:division/cell wall cluster transcriptional repressor MraZ [Deltaproteobacteria bacterium]
MAIMFRGQFTHSIDAKGRVAVPSRFRDALAASGDNRLVLTPALFDPCIHVFPVRAWEEFEAKVAQMKQFDANAVRLRRLYVSAAVDCELDKQGRLLVPPQLREHGSLAKEVLWAGVGNKAELWATDRWADAIRMTDEERAEFQRQAAEWGI